MEMLMSRLSKLINQLCPEGVEYKTLDDIANYRRGSFPQPYGQTSWYGGEGAMPFVQVADVTETFELVKETKQTISVLAQPKSVFVPKGTVIVTLQGTIGRVAITQYDSYVDRTLAIFESFKIDINKKYFAYQLKAKFDIEKQHARGSTLKTITKEEFSKFTMPVPPMEVQCEIVRILDNFTELTAELTAELDARTRQYSEISYRLLFDSHDVEKVLIKDICTLVKGKTPIQKAIAGDYPMVVTTTERKTCNTYQFDTKAVCIPLISSRGHGVASLNHVYYQEGKFALGNILCAMIPDDENYVSAKYLYYYFECTKDYTLVPLMKGGANVAMHVSDIEKVKVPIPPLEVQRSIVSKLELMEEYHKNLLPAEIEARKKQYEYYRDRLLTFKEKVA